MAIGATAVARERSQPSPPLWLLVEGRWALVQAAGMQMPAWPDEPVRLHALLAIADREGAALLRKAAYGQSVTLSLWQEGWGAAGSNASLSHHLRLHPLVITRRVDANHSAILMLPACADLTRSDISCEHVIVTGRGRSELLRNAWRRLVALAAMPLHPSWEGPAMAHLEKVSLKKADWDDPPLELLQGGGVLHFAYLHRSSAQREVEELWQKGKLPTPAA